MNDYIVIITKGETRRIRQVGHIETKEGCLYFYNKTTLLAVFSIQNIVGVFREDKMQ